MAEKIFGIDVSLYQKGMDFERAAREGVKYAVIKATESKFVDPEFENNYRRAKAAGLGVGAYHYLTATTAAEAVNCADYMIDKCLKGKVFDYPIFVDAEDSALKRLPKEQVTKIVTAFCDRLESAGYWAGFYTNLDWYRNHLDGASLARRYSFWFAYWGESCPLDDAQMWQFGGNVNMIRKNVVAGVVCDQDYCFVDFPKKIAAKGLNGMKKTPVTEGPSDSMKALDVGDRVRLKSDATVYGSTKRFAPWVYEAVLYVREMSGSRIVVSTQMTGAVTGAVDRKYLVKV